MASTERLCLLDSMALAYRAHFAYIQRPLTTSAGQPTSAVFGFVSFLQRILQQEYPDHIAAVFDTQAPTFRHEAYAEYKATREDMPEALVSQIPLIKEVIQAYHIPVVEMDGYEADDVIGTLARQAEKEGVRTFIVTADKDMMQLVSDIIKLYRPGKQGGDLEVVGIDGVREKFGVAPNQVIDVLALMGDSSDNVPGVRGIGEKTAIPLIQKHGSIEALYQNLAAVESKSVRAKLEAGQELAFLSKKLVTIDTAVPLALSFHDLRASAPDTDRLRQLFETLEFRSLAAKIQQHSAPHAPAAPVAEEALPIEQPKTNIRSDEHTYTLITAESEFDKLCDRLSASSFFVFDTETTSTDALNADLVGVSFAMKPREAFFVSIRTEAPPAGTDLFTQSQPLSLRRQGIPLEHCIARLKPILENPAITKCGHNIKYDMLVLSRYGIATTGDVVDTMIASYVLRADAQHGMDAAALEHLGYRTVSYSDLVGTGKARKDIREVPLTELSDYSSEDADITFRLADALKQKVDAQGMLALCEQLEYPLVSVLMRMEATGVAIDPGFLAEMSKELEKQLEGLTKDIHELAGGPFNINSTQQLAEILFNRLQLPTVRKTKTGFSTDVAVLEELRHKHPIVDKLLDYRQLAKLKSTYVDALPKLVNPRTGRVHTSFNQTVATTGRLSSSDPNLQNIPIRTDIGRSIRRAFVAGDPSSVILSADYSQIELRVMAHISGDEGLIEAFLNREDIHATTAARVFGVALSEVSKDMRRKAKEVNFGIMYGIGAFGLAGRLEISQAEARDIIDKYFARFPKVKQYIEATKASARELGYVSTLLGRRRYIPDIRSTNQAVRANAERQAINMPIQGTSADMIKRAMVDIDRTIREHSLSGRMVLQVHDELVFEVPKREVENMRVLVEERMKGALPLAVPVEVEIGVGGNWGEAH
jgi:DNA polymerase-1